MMRNRFLYIVLLVIGGIISSSLRAQSVFSISESFRSSRSLGMGGISSIVEDNAFAIYDNAATVASSDKKVMFGLQYSPWGLGATKSMEHDNLLLNTAGFFSLNSKHKLLVGITYYKPGGDDMYIMDEDGNVVGDEIVPQFYSVNMGYAFRIGDQWGVAATLNYNLWNPNVEEKISALSFDLSANRSFDLSNNEKINLLFRLAGWGKALTDLDGYKLPGLLGVGSWYEKRFSKRHLLHAGLDIQYRCLDNPCFKSALGVEYVFKNFLYSRLGYNFNSKNNADTGFGSIGLGIKILNKLQFDASYLLTGEKSPLKNTFMLGMDIAF